jgi:hypothetical protein
MFTTADRVSGGSGGHIHIQTVNMTEPHNKSTTATPSQIFATAILAEGGNANDNNQGMGGSGGRIIIAFALNSSEALLLPTKDVKKVLARGGTNPTSA